MPADVLIAEDSPTQAEQLRGLLVRERHSPVVASSGEEALERLAHSKFDILLTDVVMPGMDGYELCRRVKQEFDDLPVVLVTSLADPMDIVRGLEAGADNYITKPYDPANLVARIRRVLDNRRLRGKARTSLGVNIKFLGNTFTITSDREQVLDLLLSSVEDVVRINKELEVRQAELAEAHSLLEMYATQQAREARRSTGRYESLMQNAGDAIFVLDEEGRVTEVNPRAAQLLGISAVDLVGQPISNALGIQISESVRDEQSAPLSTSRMGPVRIVRPDQKEVWLEVSSAIVPLGDETAVLAIARDLTERLATEALLKSREEELRQVQKMNAIGRLAGGIAHDFNNLLTAILAPAELARAQLPPDHPVVQDLNDITTAAKRGADLTRQLLSFGRQAPMTGEMLDLNDVIEESCRLLRRLLGASVEVEVSLRRPLARVFADRTQLHQVVMNLALNARDAMPGGGVITIETREADLDAHYVEDHPSVKTGRYVQLSVTDTGSGMDEKTLKHLFEPFFTTKQPNKGTGLGLTIVHGIVTQAGGHIWVYSEQGRGTTFKAYLPMAEPEEVETARPSRVVKARGGHEAILLADDDEKIRRIAARTLMMAGYRVLAAANGREALDVFAEHRGSIALLVTDVVMPEVTGSELAAEVWKLEPGMPVIFLSGYADRAAMTHGGLMPDSSFLEKPFTLDALTTKVREMLDSLPLETSGGS